MENKKISITTYSVEKITVNVRMVRLKPADPHEQASDAVSSLGLPILAAESIASEAINDDSEKGEKK